MADHRARIYGTEEDQVNCPVRALFVGGRGIVGVRPSDGSLSHWCVRAPRWAHSLTPLMCGTMANAPQFYIKMGACRHCARCGRQHIQPLFSCTIMIPHMWQLPAPDARGKPQFDNEACDDFVEDVRHPAMESVEHCYRQAFIVCLVIRFSKNSANTVTLRSWPCAKTWVTTLLATFTSSSAPRNKQRPA